MTRRRTGAGQVTAIPAGDRVSAVLSNFDIDWHELKPEHQQWLDQYAVPKIREGGSISVEGRASRTGSHEHNQALSERRLREVLAYVRQRAGREFRSAQSVALGEQAAASSGWPDDTEDAWYRSVVVTAWSKPDPPPPQKTTPTTKIIMILIVLLFCSMFFKNY